MTVFRSFEEIDAWQKARQLVKEIYAVSGRGTFARDSALHDQIGRASISVRSNIAEGFERRGNAEFIHFLSIARGSVAEVRTQIYLAFDQAYIDRNQSADLQALIVEVQGKIGGLAAYLRKSGLRGSKFKS